MTVLPAVDGAQEAKARAERIRSGLKGLAPDILAAWQARDWEVLGYPSWNEYVIGEFGSQLRLGRAERRQIVADMRAKGMSHRAIGAALDVAPDTVRRDLNDVHDIAHLPDRSTGLDGKTYPASSEAPPLAAHWSELKGAVETLGKLLSSEATEIAAAVPTRRRASTAKRLRKLGTGLGRIAWSLEGMEDSDGHPV